MRLSVSSKVGTCQRLIVILVQDTLMYEMLRSILQTNARSSLEEEEGEMDITEEMLLQSRMTTLMQCLVRSTFGTLSAEDSIGQLLLKEPSQKPESELVHQAWEEGMGIRICLRILEQVVTNWVSDFSSSVFAGI